MAQQHYQIMISSTGKELADHRAAVAQAALGQQMVPIDMANDPALPDKDLIDTALAKVDEADAYVGLIGYRYGQIPECEDRNPDRLSLTELEFRRARARGIPIRMFIMSDGYPVPHALVENASATLDRLQAFRALAKKDQIHAEFISIDNLKAKVIPALAQLRQILDAAAAREPPPAPDHHAPPAVHAKPPDLAGSAVQGRARENAKLAYMANQIGRFFQSQKQDAAVAGIEDHLLKFWDPRMRRAIVAQLAAGTAELDPLVREAVQNIARRSVA